MNEGGRSHRTVTQDTDPSARPSGTIRWHSGGPEGLGGG
jgi:hypothetical protein